MYAYTYYVLIPSIYFVRHRNYYLLVFVFMIDYCFSGVERSMVTYFCNHANDCCGHPWRILCVRDSQSFGMSMVVYLERYLVVAVVRGGHVSG